MLLEPYTSGRSWATVCDTLVIQSAKPWRQTSIISWTIYTSDLTGGTGLGYIRASLMLQDFWLRLADAIDAGCGAVGR